MNIESKKHHFVPQSILKRFSIECNGKEIYVFDKKTEKIFNSSILNAGSENYFNTLTINNEKLNLESLYQEIDNTCAAVTEKIVSNASLINFDNADYCEIAFITASQMKRTKIMRSTLKHLNEQLHKTFEEIKGKISNTTHNYKTLSDDEIKAIAIMSSIDVEEEVISLLTKDIYLIKNISSTPFIISDCPVIMHNSFSYGGGGLDSEGVEIYFPIDKNYMIAFCCPSITSKLEKLDLLGANFEEGKKLLCAINTTTVFELDDINFVEFYNQLQVLNSSRFVYSCSDNHEFINEIIKAFPKSKERTTTKTLGGLGKAPPPNNKLPKDDLFVVYGASDHNLLKIEFVKETDTSIFFKTENMFLLEMILSDLPLKRIEYYKNQSLRRLIGKPEIIKISDDTYEMTHADKSISKIFELIKKEKNGR